MATQPELVDTELILMATQPELLDTELILMATQPELLDTELMLMATQPELLDTDLILMATQPELVDTELKPVSKLLSIGLQDGLLARWFHVGLMASPDLSQDREEPELEPQSEPTHLNTARRIFCTLQAKKPKNQVKVIP